LLEGPLLDRCSDAALAALLLAFSLPLLAWYLIRAAFDFACAAITHRRSGRGLNPPKRSGLLRLKPQFVGEFAFDRAIEAYEHLIDSTYAEGLE
jgi:hypothetical protein